MDENNIPRDTLVGLIKKKDRDVKTLEAKLEKIEDRYCRTFKFNKILHEDRVAFMRFSQLVLGTHYEESAFEEAAAQETPVNLNLLTSALESVERKNRELEILRDLVRLIWPNQAGSILETPIENLESALRNRWISLEELQSRSLQEANFVAQQNAQSQEDSMKSLELELRSLKAENKDLSLQLQSMKTQQNMRAQQLTSRIQGSSLPGNGFVVEIGRDSGESTVSPADSGDRYRDLELQISTLRKENTTLEGKLEQIDSSYKAELELAQKMVASIKAQNLEEKKRLLEQLSSKERELLKTEQKITSMEEELDSNRMITRAAELQANRDLILKEQSEESRKLKYQTREMELKLRKCLEEEKGLKSRIRELEIMSDANVDKAYLREVIYKYCEYSQRGDMKAQSLIPAVCTVIGCSNTERDALMKVSLPTPWLVLNQAVGTWAGSNKDQGEDVKAGGNSNSNSLANSRRTSHSKGGAGGKAGGSQPPTPSGPKSGALNASIAGASAAAASRTGSHPSSSSTPKNPAAADGVARNSASGTPSQLSGGQLNLSGNLNQSVGTPQKAGSTVSPGGSSSTTTASNGKTGGLDTRDVKVDVKGGGSTATTTAGGGTANAKPPTAPSGKAKPGPPGKSLLGI